MDWWTNILDRWINRQKEKTEIQSGQTDGQTVWTLTRVLLPGGHSRPWPSWVSSMFHLAGEWQGGTAHLDSKCNKCNVKLNYNNCKKCKEKCKIKLIYNQCNHCLIKPIENKCNQCNIKLIFSNTSQLKSVSYKAATNVISVKFKPNSLTIHW